MGQRHQIYVFYHSKYVQAPGGLKCIVFHNQWCYGTLPLQNVRRFVEFQLKAEEFSQISSSEGMDDNDSEKIRMLLSLDVMNGDFFRIHDITQEVTTEEGGINPDFGDNNDGITVIYIPQDVKRIKYCFMGLGNVCDVKRPKSPVDAYRYVRHYYTSTSKKWKAWKIGKLVEQVTKGADLLTQEECFKLFPGWYVPEIEREAIKKASKDDLPLFINCHELNRGLLERRLGKGRKG